MAGIVETAGGFVGQGEALTAEAVAAKWDQITDVNTTRPAFKAGG
jgi:hypothetical protein